jgi:hypothetical protein
LGHYWYGSIKTSAQHGVTVGVNKIFTLAQHGVIVGKYKQVIASEKYSTY